VDVGDITDFRTAKEIKGGYNPMRRPNFLLNCKAAALEYKTQIFLEFMTKY